jgi:hypothetical protein
MMGQTPAGEEVIYQDFGVFVVKSPILPEASGRYIQGSQSHR